MVWAYVVMAVVAAGAGLAGACGSSMMAPGCPQGTETCACYGNMTCNPGLTCLSNLCVNPSTGNGGHSGAGGASSPGTGGMTGAAGVFGGAGITGTAGTSGGAGTTGAGGSSTTPTNLIKNGDFGLGKEYWNLTWQAGESATDNQASGGQYCIGNPSSSYYLSFSLGYPPTPSDALSIAAGATYTLTYQVAVDQPASLMVKIGQVETPYTELTSFTDSVTSSNFTTFSHQFSSPNAAPGEGLVFNASLYYLASICFDNVTLVKN